ncbi:MAG: hypothetical protein A3E81_01410 [Gammaproteobacteria bacterium RIFCSPHIGHO2_12_FULL_36_30]|nr:MAG: hypothetical protein A3E81_01410 [Gammaproteobacteria bacterium RIFCSPHIGHO2_12_FULL_36_30]
MLFFIVLQFILLAFMLLHDWISVPSLNDLEALKKYESNARRILGSIINGAWVFIPLVLTLIYYHDLQFPLSARLTIFCFYFFLSVGVILSWWTPYFFTSSEKHKREFLKFYNTYHFLPARGDNVIPNTLHVILHLQVWTCLIFSIYFLIK